MKKIYLVFIFLINTLFIISCNNELIEKVKDNQNIVSDTNNGLLLEDDTTPPTITFIASSLELENSGNLILTANAEDASGISKINIYQGNTLLYSSISSLATTSLNITSANNGELVFTAVAFDNANSVNSTTSNPVTIQVDIKKIISNCSGSVSGSTVKRFTEIADGTGRLREVEIETSAAYKKGGLAPVVIVFHGNGGTIDISRGFDFMRAINEANDAGIVIIPQGIDYGGYGIGWDETKNGYDMPFFDNILAYVNEHYCADLSKVFVTGFSWGGDMTNALACLRGDKIRGLANFSGGDLVNKTNTCTTTNYPAVLFRYGTIAGADGDGVYSLKKFEAVETFYKLALGVITLSLDNKSTNIKEDFCVQFSAGSQPLIICADPTIGHNSPSLDEAKYTWEFWKNLQ